MKSTLRPHQTRTMALLRQSLGRGSKRPMICLPTGSGKTKFAAAIVDGALSKNKRVIFTVPAVSLINQTVESFEAEGFDDIGVIQADHPRQNFGSPVQVASAQTLMRRFIPDADVVVIDEAHRHFNFYTRWMGQEAFRDVPFIGLSATPYTVGLGNHYDDLIVGATMRELINAGYLSDFVVYVPSEPDLSKVRTVAGDYHEGDLSEVMGDSALVGDVVETWLKLGTGSKTLCFGVDRAHARKLQAEFQRVGVACGYIDANTPVSEREAIAEDFKAGGIQVVANVGVLTTGVDWDVRCLILARPTKSEALFQQIIGRALRTAPSKDKAIILDHSNTHKNLGLVTDITISRLSKGKGKQATGGVERKEAQEKVCPSCSFLKLPKVHECPMCGFAPERKSEIEHAAGELVSFGSKSAQKKPTPEEKSLFYRRLLGYAHQRGKSQSWVLAKFKSKYGEWPHKKHGVQPLEPTPDVIGWIKHSNIKYAKSKARASA